MFDVLGRPRAERNRLIGLKFLQVGLKQFGQVGRLNQVSTPVVVFELFNVVELDQVVGCVVPVPALLVELFE